MTSHPLSQWLKFLRGALPALHHAGADWPAAQAHCAQFAKSTLELGKDLGDLHGATCLALLQAQLDMLGTTSPARTAQGLLDVHLDTMSQWYAHWKTLSDTAAARSEACVADLRQAQNRNDVSFVMAGFLRELETGMRKASGDAALLFQSAGAAAGVLASRALDDLIAPPAGTAQQQQQQD